jgi:hypothetical protein
MEFYVSVAPLYEERFAGPSWARYRNADREPWDALGIFLERYAFERQGRNPSFAHAACYVIRQFSKRPLGTVSASECWNQFREALKTKTSSKGLNPGNNPMAPKGTKLRSSRGRTKGQSAIEFSRDLDDPRGLVAWALHGLANNQTGEVHRGLCNITGVGKKIASFFLRDLACEYKAFPGGNDRNLLQPVDTWVRRCVKLANDSQDPDSEEAVATWIVEHSGQPELANQGMWYFAAQVAGSEFRLRSLLSTEAAQDLMRDHARGLVAGVEAWSGR